MVSALGPAGTSAPAEPDRWTGGPCVTCDFDPSEWNRQDAAGTLRCADGLWAHLLAGVDPSFFDTPPQRDILAGLASRSREGLEEALAAAERRLQVRRPAVLASPDSTGNPLDVDARPAARAADALAVLATTYREPAAVKALQGPVTAAVHRLTHDLRAAGRFLVQWDRNGPFPVGRISQLSVSQGGVPKRAAPTATVTRRGLVGDRQAARVHHGRPWQAVCLWSQEVIATLVTEGHRVTAGACGENVTLEGVDWHRVRPGVRVAVGEVLLEVSSYAIPCAKNARWFVDGTFDRMSHERHPGSSRVYAWVLRPGELRAGDPVVVEP